MTADTKAHIVYAQGNGWTAFLADDGATPAQTTLQMQLNGDTGGLLKESMNGDQYPVPTADAQQTTMSMVAAALHGVTRTT